MHGLAKANKRDVSSYIVREQKGKLKQEEIKDRNISSYE